MNQDEEEIIKDCSRIFSDDTGPYEMGRQLSIENLSKTGELDDKALMDFRKALQDLGTFFEYLDDGDTPKANEKLDEINDNLQKTACESAKRTARYQFNTVKEKKLTRPLFYKFLLLDAPKKFQKRMQRIGERIELGDEKNPREWRRSVAYYKEASEMAEDLDNELPSRQKIRKQIVTGLVSLISILGATVGLLSFFGYNYSIVSNYIHLFLLS